MMPQKVLFDPTKDVGGCGVGFIVDILGRKSHSLITQGLTILKNLEHRGACGCEVNTGDGAGILIQMPHNFLKKECEKMDIQLPPPLQYGAGMVFLPQDPHLLSECHALIEEIIQEEGQSLLGWRTVPTNDTSLGPTAKALLPIFKQVFIARDPFIGDDNAFERKLYIIRKRIEHRVASIPKIENKWFHIPSLSSRTLIYKGMLMAHQIELLFLDLLDLGMESALALVHQRFSTNTFPSWPLAHPYRYIAHNGEINTLRGNINWMRAREALCDSELIPELKKILPIIIEGGSDSAIFDNVLEFLVMAGRPLPHAILMMIPEAWYGHESMHRDLKAFYEYHSCLMEPWDGPASIAFTDGVRIGAVLDRNGLRPSRYYVTTEDQVIMASEVGVLDIPDEKIKIKERLHPGRIFLVDTALGRIIEDTELKQNYANQHPYQKWLKEHLISLDDLPEGESPKERDLETKRRLQQIFGYTQEDLRILIEPMAVQGEEPVGSMGNDAALPVLSNHPRLLYDYFSQLFAQVTNPPLDAIREELITQMSTTLGAEKNLLNPQPESCRQIKIKTPILSNQEMAKLKSLSLKGFKVVTLPIHFSVDHPLEEALQTLQKKASQAIEDGANILILSDMGVSAELMPIPALLATSGIHHHLVKKGTRTKVGLVVESAEPREVHHMALLIGYGAVAINPYLALDIAKEINPDHGVENLIKALHKGVLKVISKMGISTIQSYRGAQIFEAVGLRSEVIQNYFTGTPSRVGGIGLDLIALESSMRHRQGYLPNLQNSLRNGGEYQWRRDGEYHLLNPDVIVKLQMATRTGNYQLFKEYSDLVDQQNTHLATLRGLFEFQIDQSIPLDEVEPIETIVKRFATGAMSYGSISQEVHETIAIAMNRIGARSNTGEGGEDPARYQIDLNGDNRRSAIKQVASGRFGVTSEYLVNATDLQIKIAQGSKPGEGGQLSGKKVYPWIAKVRYSIPGVGLISPPPHHDIYSIEDIAQLIRDLKFSNPKARVHVKLVAEFGVGTVAAGVAKARSDVVLISGHDGGTGASPLSSIKHAGIPWELGLSETHQVLMLQKLRDRITVQVDGQMKTARDVVIAALLGAEEFGFSTAPLAVLGCIMMRVCHLNTCPVGIATQDPELRKKFSGKPEHLINFFYFTAQGVREWMSKLGFRTFHEMIGRVDKLEMRKAIDHWKARGLDYSAILSHLPQKIEITPYKCQEQNHGLEESLDRTDLIPRSLPALKHREQVTFSLPIRNTHRTVGTLLGYEVTSRYGSIGLPDDTIQISFKGSAGQSFGAFLPPGITLYLEGDANDYTCKGLSGGKVCVYPPKNSIFKPEENILVGNVVLYGATSGEAYFRGVAGERFCVRNSGAYTVVEGVGDHGCEYMTGGRVLVIGKTGRNFAAGMSGGIAYVFDPTDDFKRRCNLQMVDLERLSLPEDWEEVQEMLKKHLHYTQSLVAKNLLKDWSIVQSQFWKVMPNDYRRVLKVIQRAKQEGKDWEKMVMEEAHG